MSFLKNFIYIYKRKREWEGGEERIWVKLCTGLDSRTMRPWWAEMKSWTLNQLNQPGAPKLSLSFKNTKYYSFISIIGTVSLWFLFFKLTLDLSHVDKHKISTKGPIIARIVSKEDWKIIYFSYAFANAIAIYIY